MFYIRIDVFFFFLYEARPRAPILVAGWVYSSPNDSREPLRDSNPLCFWGHERDAFFLPN